MSNSPATLDEFSQPHFTMTDFLDKDENMVLAKAFAANHGYATGVMDTVRYIRKIIAVFMDLYPEADMDKLLNTIEYRLGEETSHMIGSMCDADADNNLKAYFTL